MLLHKATNTYLIIVIIALVVGVWLSDYTIYLAPYSTLFLGAIFFLSSLKIHLRDVIRQFDDKAMLITVNVFMLIVLPVVVYYATT